MNRLRSFAPPGNLSREEARLYRGLSTPRKIQDYLDALPYNKERDGETCRSPRVVIRHQTAHCFEAALFAAAALRTHGDPPWLLDLEAVRDDDHVVAVYRRNRHWGAIAKSNYSGLRFREPVYRTLRELVMSYFEGYYNLQGEKTLRAFSRPVDLKRFDHLSWMTTEEPLWAIPEHLAGVSHTPILTPSMKRRRMWMDGRSFRAGRLGAAE